MSFGKNISSIISSLVTEGESSYNNGPVTSKTQIDNTMAGWKRDHKDDIARANNPANQGYHDDKMLAVRNKEAGGESIAAKTKSFATQTYNHAEQGIKDGWGKIKSGEALDATKKHLGEHGGKYAAGAAILGAGMAAGKYLGGKKKV